MSAAVAFFRENLMERTINYRAVHTRTVWRRVRGHQSLQNALYGTKDGAPGLFARKVRIDYAKHGDPLYVVVWEDGASVGYIVRPEAGRPTGTRQVTVPIDVVLAFEAHGGASPAELERHFFVESKEPVSSTPTAPTEESIISLGGPDMEADEGNAKLRMHVERERNPTLAQAKRMAILKATGKLACEACGFDFAVTYGEIGAGFCEVHHLRPLGVRVGAESTTIHDLAILCSNCHSIIHRTTPMWSVAQLAAHLRRTQS